MEQVDNIEEPKWWIRHILYYLRTWFGFIVLGPNHFFRRSHVPRKRYLSDTNFLIINVAVIATVLSGIHVFYGSREQSKEEYVALGIVLSLSYIFFFPFGMLVLTILKKANHVSRLVTVLKYSTALVVLEILLLLRVDWAIGEMGYVDVFQAMKNYRNINEVYLLSLIVPALLFLMSTYYILSGLCSINRLKWSKVFAVSDKVIPSLIICAVLLSPGIIAAKQQRYLPGHTGVQINTQSSCVPIRIFKDVKKNVWDYDVEIADDKEEIYPITVHIHNTGNLEAKNVYADIQFSDNTKMIGCTIRADNWRGISRNYVSFIGPGRVEVQKLLFYEDKEHKYLELDPQKDIIVRQRDNGIVVTIPTLPPSKNILVRYVVKTYPK